MSRGASKSGSSRVLTSSPSGPKSPYRRYDTSWWREDGTDARAFLAKAAATFTVLSFLPVALSGFAPSHASPVLRPISDFDLGGVAVGDIPWPTALFAAFTYDRGLVLGTYARFAYNATSGIATTVSGGVAGDTQVPYLDSIAIDGFPPARSAAAHGPIFEADGYLVTLTAHDDPTGLIEIRSEMARGVTIELPASAANISLLSASGQARASTVSFTIRGEEARLFLGSGSVNVTGTRVVAEMASPDLLVFKSVPAASTNKAEWRAVLDAISAGQVVAELDLVATADGHWMQNPARYRIDVAAWPLAVRPRAASAQVDTLRPGGAIVLFAFDPSTMPTDGSAQLSVSANGEAVNRSDDTLTLFYTFDSVARNASYTLLPLPGTVVAVYLPSLSAVSVDIVSLPPPAPRPAFDPGSEAAVGAPPGIVPIAAPRMLRRQGK